MKGIAIETIIKMVLAVLVLAVVGMLLFTSLRTGGGMSVQQCRSALVDMCTRCKLADWGSVTVKVGEGTCSSTILSENFALSSGLITALHGGSLTCDDSTYKSELQSLCVSLGVE